MNSPTHSGQRYLVVQVTKYCQHGKVLEIGAEPTNENRRDIYICGAEKLAALNQFAQPEY